MPEQAPPTYAVLLASSANRDHRIWTSLAEAVNTSSMDHLIPAVFDSGVFRPLEPVELAEGTQVQVQVPQRAERIPDEVDDETRKEWIDYLDRMKSTPTESPQDGLSNRDHDRIIYGV